MFVVVGSNQTYKEEEESNRRGMCVPHQDVDHHGQYLAARNHGQISAKSDATAHTARKRTLQVLPITVKEVAETAARAKKEKYAILQPMNTDTPNHSALRPVQSKLLTVDSSPEDNMIISMGTDPMRLE